LANSFFKKSKKGMLIASLFFVLSLNALSTDNRAERFYQLGYEYSQKSQNKSAFRWMLRAANAGHIAAQNNIGLSYLHGLGVQKNIKQAFFWFEKAAKQGLSYAQSELAMLYYQQQKIKKAQQWWEIAAKQNDEYAQFNLASLFLEQKKPQQAFYWFKIADKNHHPNAKKALQQLEKKYAK
jgi:TPR repeat protein